MFYEGSLQEGISTAVDRQKLVLCFVTSETWPHHRGIVMIQVLTFHRRK